MHVCLGGCCRLDDAPGGIDAFHEFLERLAAAQRVHDRIQARLREARRLEFERASRSGLSEQQIAEVTRVPLEDVRRLVRP